MEVSYGVKGEIIIDRKNVVICSGTVWMVIAVRFNIKLASRAYSKFMWKIISQAHPFCMSNDILPDVR